MTVRAAHALAYDVLGIVEVTKPPLVADAVPR